MEIPQGLLRQDKTNKIIP